MDGDAPDREPPGATAGWRTASTATGGRALDAVLTDAHPSADHARVIARRRDTSMPSG